MIDVDPELYVVIQKKEKVGQETDRRTGAQETLSWSRSQDSHRLAPRLILEAGASNGRVREQGTLT